MHLQDGAPKKHYTEHHNTALTRDDLVTNTSILAHCQDRRRLVTLETVYIRDKKPIINIQTKQNTSLSLYDKVLAAGWLSYLSYARTYLAMVFLMWPSFAEDERMCLGL